MKQILEERKALAKKKGTVLMTVVGVMMVLVVFLISTLVLTASANRRSYYTYYETQAQYAAQAALDAVTNSAYSNKSFYDWVSTKVVTGESPKPITVDFAATSNIQFTNNDKVVNCTIERIPDNYVWDRDTKAIHSQRAWKITATASVGKGRNRADYTVCNYIYENYRAPEEGLNSGIQNQAESTVYNDPEDEEEQSKVIAIGTMQYGGASSANNMIYLGPQITGTSKLPDGRGNYDGKEQKVDNNNGAVGNIVFTNGIQSNVHIVNEFQRKGECAVYYGNIVGGNSSVVSWYANIQDTYKPTDYSEYNFVYVEGKMNPGQTNLIVGRRKNGTEVGTAGNYPVNLFAGCVDTSQAQTQKSVVVYGDAYLLDPELDSYWDGYTDGTSTLASFVSNNVNKANVNANLNAPVGGNIYSMNRNLTLSGEKKKLVIDGNVVFANPGGTLTIKGNVEVKGKIICAGTYSGNLPAITGTAVNSYIDTAYAYYNPNYKTSVPNDTFTEQKQVIDTVTYIYTFVCGYSDPNYGAEAAKPGNITAGWSGDLKDPSQFTQGGVYHEEVKTTYKTETVTSTVNYDFSLFPFGYRSDEIFERYYRWDLKQPSTVGKAQTVANAKNDLLVKESIACGHNWEGAELMTDCYGNSYYVPYTFPVNMAHKLIDEFKVANPTSAVDSLKANSDPVYETEADFKNAMGTTAAGKTISVGAGSGVKICYHSNNENESELILPNATLVSESCVLNVASGATVVLDPSQRPNKNVPLYIYLTGGGSCDIIVNNTANYALGAMEPVAYFDEATRKATTLAAHGEVCIFLDPAFNCDKVTIMTSGMYGRLAGAPGENKTGDLYIVQNPIYPGDPNFGKNTAELVDNVRVYDKKFTFAYELVPNAILMGQKGATYFGTNGFFWNAEVIMPTARLGAGTSNFCNARPYYREEWDSLTRVGEASTYLIGVGGSMTDSITLNDKYGSLAYIGDSHRKTISTITYGNNSSDLGADNKDYLHNNYQGAN